MTMMAENLLKTYKKKNPSTWNEFRIAVIGYISHFGWMIQYHKDIIISLSMGFGVRVNVGSKKQAYHMAVNVGT